MNQNKVSLGIELGSTRIKGVLLDENHQIIAQGFFDWENQIKDGVWTYPMDLIHEGVQTCYRTLNEDYKNKYGEDLTTLGAIGISAMMHGYLAFDKNDNLLVPFRTWRNTMTKDACEKLTPLLGFNIPQRWSIAHLTQAILNKEKHIKDLSYITTLAVYIHYRLTGKKVAGVGEASGMFPIDSNTNDYNLEMVKKYNQFIKEYADITLENVLPKVLVAGDDAGTLTEEGALFLDPTGTLKAGVKLVPPEGDAGTGMVATNSVRVGTGNVSAGTSDFAMIVTDRKVGVHREIDMVTTPDGKAVAMVHCNNCTSDINAWVNLFNEVLNLFGTDVDKATLFTKLFEKSSEGEKDCGGLVSFNYFSGEGVTDLDEGRPLLIRKPDARFTLANMMKVNIMSSMSTLKIGLDILTKEEGITVGKIYGHGGFFKTPVIGQKMLSAAVNAPVTCMESSGEGGAYGMALLGSYYLEKEDGETLPDYLDKKVFADVKTTTVMADKEDIDGFNVFIKQYVAALEVEKEAIKSVR